MSASSNALLNLLRSESAAVHAAKPPCLVIRVLAAPVFALTSLLGDGAALFLAAKGASADTLNAWSLETFFDRARSGGARPPHPFFSCVYFLPARSPLQGPPPPLRFASARRHRPVCVGAHHVA